MKRTHCILIALLVTFHTGCVTGEDPDTCSVGSEGCACTAGGSCDQGLACLSSICVDTGSETAAPDEASGLNGDGSPVDPTTSGDRGPTEQGTTPSTAPTESDTDGTTQNTGEVSVEVDPATEEDSTPTPPPARCPDDMVQLGSEPLCIDRYEASRPDASIETDGSEIGAARSVPGVMPWFDATYYIATAACNDAGKRLCTGAEWQSACEGPSQTTYPYGDTHDAQLCGDGETILDLLAEGPYPQSICCPGVTGAFPGCEGGYPGIFDMSGNQMELVSDVWPETREACNDETWAGEMSPSELDGACIQFMGGKSFGAPEESTCSATSPGNKGWDLGVHRGFRCCKDL